jgi:hypothetical protein
MKPKQWTTTFTTGLALVALAAGSVVGEEEVRDRITAHLKEGADPNKAVVELWISNTNPVIAMTLPFKFAAGDSLAFDSLNVAGGRAGEFAVVGPVYRSENQTLLIHLMWARDTTVQAPPIPVGSGPLMQIYLSTPKAFPMSDFRMASVQLPPQNVLMFVTETLNSVTPDFAFTREAPPRAWGATAERPKAD